jgi:ribosome-associated protein
LPKARRLSPLTAALPSPEPLLRVIRAALEDIKAIDIREIDVRGRTGVTDFMVVASGTSTRHVKSIAEEVQRRARQAGFAPIGVEGEREAEWVLVDLGDAVVHVMLPRVRELYMLERLWGDGARSQVPVQDDARPSSA